MIHTLIRAVIIQADRLLVARPQGADYVVLPGGHLEQGERAAETLRRELRQDTGLDVIPGAFLGAAECLWDDAGHAYHEIDLLFSVDLPGDAPVHSRAAHLSFEWIEVDEMENVNLQPPHARNIVAVRLGAAPDFYSDFPG